MTDRELMQMALDALEWFERREPFQGLKFATDAAEALRVRLAQPENKFNPDWNAMAVMVEEQQRMAKRIEELEAALAQPEPEPTAYLCENAVGYKYFRWKKPSSEYKPIALYTAHASPQRIWQGLTDEEIQDMWSDHCRNWQRLGKVLISPTVFGQAIEAKLKEKNGF